MDDDERVWSGRLRACSNNMDHRGKIVKETILVVDDNPRNLQSMRGVLQPLTDDNSRW
ncbi:MAG: hypothetical protein HOI61_10205 [Gammaproteobacteria bacterium]|nr:hypothetical protein [Gammaproteobacteria bacterium]MBT4299815.1 hypothetical protein [Gammaproteobacteria bacterium]MBT5688881.1 hypothetical protein [Gammaproteobacteria bacterium]MBT6652023.1 hypothetical protein [Gammaproteobacteria bacterium]MBT7141650.1 hypothetical protein [Gammaproteobacteria bacterium]